MKKTLYKKEEEEVFVYWYHHLNHHHNLNNHLSWSSSTVVKNIYPQNFLKEYLALQNTPQNLIYAWKLSLNEGNYALKIDGGRQTERQTDRQSLF